jgi:hypothetical protein
MTDTTTLDRAQAELAGGMFPHPDDFMEDLTPPAALLFARQVSMAALKVLTGAAVSLEEDPDSEAGPIAEVLNGLAMSIAGLTHSMVALELLPPEAEEAMSAGSA